MAKTYPKFDRYIGGISDYEKEQQAESSVAFSRNIDLRSDPRSFKLNPKTVKESGSIILDLPKWADRISDDVFVYGDTGNIYQRNSSTSWSLLRQIGASQGNGLAYYGEDDYLYYASNVVLGRYGQFA